VNIIKDVVFIVNLAAADHVEDLHEHERSEYECVVAGRSYLINILFIQWFTIPFVKAARVYVTSRSVEHKIRITFGDQEFSSEQEHEQDTTLPESLEKNVLCHFA